MASNRTLEVNDIIKLNYSGEKFRVILIYHNMHDIYVDMIALTPRYEGFYETLYSIQLKEFTIITQSYIRKQKLNQLFCK